MCECRHQLHKCECRHQLYADYAGTNFTLTPHRPTLAAMDPPYISLTNQYYIFQDGATPRIFVLAGAAAASAEECALACSNQDGCDFASYHAADPVWTNRITCWLKQINRDGGYTCDDVVASTFRAGSYLLIRQTAECALTTALVTRVPPGAVCASLQLLQCARHLSCSFLIKALRCKH